MANHDFDLSTDDYFNLLKYPNTHKVNLNRERYKIGDILVFHELSNQFSLRSGHTIKRRIANITPIYSARRKVKSVRLYLSI